MNSYQIPEAMFSELHGEKQPAEEYFSTSRMTELCRFCSVFDSVLSVSFTVPWHLLSQLAFAAQTDKMQVCQCPTIYHLPPVAGEYSLGGKNFHGF